MIIGVDPGLSGGIAVVSSDGNRVDLVTCFHIPVFGKDAKRRVDVGEITRRVRMAVGGSNTHNLIDLCCIERAQAMPEQGASSGFVYGRAVGALEACMAMLLAPVEIIESSSWKRTHGLIKTDKEASRQRAIMLFGSEHFQLKKDHNVAEAALIAWHGAKVVLSRLGSQQRSLKLTG
jgi:crossover junction endodeoxyribonuclease RuvC